jgi:2-keto-4-pentenoate hydratase/2-oxohepta-3-ene-1,7-dioic acid hydratase in catechol pathway
MVYCIQYGTRLRFVIGTPSTSKEALTHTMRFCSFVEKGESASGVLLNREVIHLNAINRILGRSFTSTLSGLIKGYMLDEVCESVLQDADKLKGLGTDPACLKFTVPLADPPKIWCIGLNYVDHALDLDETSPEEPASFMRPANSMIGQGDTIYLPPQSERVTGEAELAVVLKRSCKNISREEAWSAIAGFLPVIDVTAEDVLRRNPRFLTRAKSFDTFLSLGTWLVTADEVGGIENLKQLRVSTRLNGQVKRTNLVANMRHDVCELIAFHSQVFTWEPGDILLTGTPGAVQLKPGDVVGCELAGIGLLENPVSKSSRS